MNVITKSEAQKCLSDVPGQYAFWCGDGMVLKNVKGLQNGLTTMSDKTYLKVAMGQQDVRVAFMLGKLKLKGDKASLATVRECFRKPNVK